MSDDMVAIRARLRALCGDVTRDTVEVWVRVADIRALLAENERLREAVMVEVKRVDDWLQQTKKERECAEKAEREALNLRNNMLAEVQARRKAEAALAARDAVWREHAERYFEGIQSNEALERVYGPGQLPAAIIHEIWKRDPRVVDAIAERRKCSQRS